MNQQPDLFYSKREMQSAKSDSFWTGFLVGALATLAAGTSAWIFIREYLIYSV